MRILGQGPLDSMSRSTVAYKTIPDVCLQAWPRIQTTCRLDGQIVERFVTVVPYFSSEIVIPNVRNLGLKIPDFGEI